MLKLNSTSIGLPQTPPLSSAAFDSHPCARDPSRGTSQPFVWNRGTFIYLSGSVIYILTHGHSSTLAY
ncbi:hypothetical protein M434DRAFT_291767 [Hypoxylon sp. CO27-5]|nr:hypothetical protein M434DRAFT_291767 [Hypoxylon sp. CO27-5]